MNKLKLPKQVVDWIRRDNRDQSEPAFSTKLFLTRGIWRVSTIYRQATIKECHVKPWFLETFVYLAEWKDRPELRTEQEWQFADVTGQDHLDVVRNIVENDGYVEVQDETN